MRGFTRAVIAGNLGHDPELRYTANGTAVVNFSVAVNRKRRDEDFTDWYRVSIFGKQAEIADEYLSKGAPVLVDGRLEIDQWEGKDGTPRTTVALVADNFQMLGGRDDEQGERESSRASGRGNGRNQGRGGRNQRGGGWEDNQFDDDFSDVPF